MSYERDTNHILGNKEIEYYALNAYKQTQQINNDFPKKKFVSTLCIQRLILAYIDQDKLDLAEKISGSGGGYQQRRRLFWPLSRNIILGAIAEKKEKLYKRYKTL